MNIIFAGQEIPQNLSNSVFLAGTTPRSKDVKSWRPEAIECFKQAGYDGTLLIPEDVNWGFKEGFSYEKQVEWEEDGLKKASCIMFWIPRELKTMPGFTTNVEFGYWMAKDPAKMVLGVPDSAEKCRYQIYYANKLGIPLANTLEQTIENAIEKVKEKLNFRNHELLAEFWKR